MWPTTYSWIGFCDMEDGGYSLFIALFVLSVPSIVMLAACFCCRKKVPK